LICTWFFKLPVSIIYAHRFIPGFWLMQSQFVKIIMLVLYIIFLFSLNQNFEASLLNKFKILIVKNLQNWNWKKLSCFEI